MTAVGRSFLPILEREGLPDRLLGENRQHLLSAEKGSPGILGKLYIRLQIIYGRANLPRDVEGMFRPKGASQRIAMAGRLH